MILHGDCLDKLKELESNSIDLVLADPPYGTTACKWDSVIPFDLMWSEINRVTKPNAAIVLTSAQPFTTAIISSNPKMFRYDLKWCKSQGTGFYNANRMPLRAHEDILIFYRKLPKFNPQKSAGKPYRAKRNSASAIYHGKDLHETISSGARFPLSWMVFKKDKNKFHPTQKPVALLEYLIKTYSDEGQTVLDFCMGSGSTGVAARNTNRKFIGIEREAEYVAIAEKRIG